MWQEVAVAAMVGLALSDSWLCLFMGASFASSDRDLGWGFLAGRTAGIITLCLAIGLLGGSLLENKGVLTIAFGLSTLVVATVLAYAMFRPEVLGGCGTPDPGASDEASLECDRSESGFC